MKHIKQTATLIIIFASMAAGLMLQPLGRAAAQVATPIPTVMTNTTVAVEAPTNPVKAGDEFTIPVTLSTDVTSWGAQFGLTYDPTLIEITSVDEGGFYKDWAAANGASGMVMPKPKADNTKGIFPITAFFLVGANPGKGPTGNGTLAILHVKALKDGTAQLNLKGIQVTDSGVNHRTGALLGGVKSQDGVISIGGGSVVQPTAAVFFEATKAPAVQNMEAQPTIARRSATDNPDGASGSIPWEIMVPLAGVIVLGGVILVVKRKK